MDTVQESDGMHVVNANLGGDSRRVCWGTLDGGNTPDVIDDEGQERGNTNFKLVRRGDVARSMGLSIETKDRVTYRSGSLRLQ